MRTSFITASLAALLAASPALAQQQPAQEPSAAGAQAQQQQQLTEQDRTFAMNAAAGNMLETRLGDLAVQQGQSQAVTDFGQRMIQDHGAANKQLVGILEAYQVTPPADLPQEHQAKVDELSGLQGQEFDQAYAVMMVEEHQKDIEAYQQQIEQGQNPELQAYAQQTLPILQEHLQMAQNLGAPGVAETPQPGEQPAGPQPSQ